ncbi:helix-turn-helix transcriptional regulator [Nocardia sp. CDC159]|uniref:Helix-turn-helix transcriptional regulator n=1 Tax=Nocardia pulmonis TaxID=2951408 RepID=A0A9X2EAC6_9NOCA|nr:MULTISPECIES: helix-turn-helix domain-containing protein [Nocardia]MCM6777252.1 helix-turn-helix transcriptional regulator [Nocardia pulmonis]MCM6790137.1 helix-turn-helix transcriptional regulator [Nocardia sp. CDC159]
MSPSIKNLGNFIRERRIDNDLTQAQLAKMVGISEETLSAIERNKRPITQGVLRPLLIALGLEPTQVQSFTGMHAESQMSDHVRPIPHEISALEAISTPACYQEIRTYRIMAANPAARRALPGLKPGISLVEWILLDPNARKVIGDWDAVAHNFVYSLKMMAPGLMEPQASAELIRSCSRAPEWDRMWNTKPDEFGPRPTMIHIDPVTGIPQAVYVTSYTLQYPRSGWWLWMLSPVRNQE